MLFAVDIDGTIATHTEERLAYLPYFNRTLGLDMSEQQLASFPDFLALNCPGSQVFTVETSRRVATD